MCTQVALQGVVSDALDASVLTVTQADISVGAARVTSSQHARTLADPMRLGTTPAMVMPQLERLTQTIAWEVAKRNAVSPGQHY